jgi:hypothetical protein
MVTSSKVMVQQTGKHSHSNRLVERKVKEVEQENIAAAALLSTVAPPRLILGASAVNLETSMPGTSGFISNRHTINQAIHKACTQLKGYPPPKPKKFDDLLEIPKQFSKTADGQQFLVLNDTVIPDNLAPSAPRILVFLSQHGKEVLAGCKSWYIDGTFKSADKTLFIQIVFLIGLTNMVKAVPCIFALLPSKEKECYARLADCINTDLLDMPKVEMESIMMDYERGLLHAFSESFPAAAIVGCQFHWKSYLRKRIASDGLMRLYNEEVDFSLLVRYIWAMAYGPINMVVPIWETIIQEKVTHCSCHIFISSKLSSVF